MKSNRTKAINIILEQEGGYVNDPRDPGGETKYGITKRSYPDENIAKLTKKRAKEIYCRDYWDDCRCDDLPAGLDILVFDCAVNQGPYFARRNLQASIGVKTDGIIGPKTLEAARQDPESALPELAARRARRYGTTPGFDDYGLGWMRRLTHIFQLAVKS